MRTSIFSLLFLIAVGVACAAPSDLAKRPDELSISLIRLVANPDDFDGKHVVVGGYLKLSDEYENSLFIDENAYRSGMSANSVAVDLATSSPEIKKRADDLDRKYVIIAGRFKAGPTAFSGGKLQSVYYIAPVPSLSGE